MTPASPEPTLTRAESRYGAESKPPAGEGRGERTAAGACSRHEKSPAARDDRRPSLADRFLLEAFGAEPTFPFPRLQFLVCAEQYIAALQSGDLDRQLINEERLDRVLDDYLGVTQAGRLRRRLGFGA